MILNLGHTVGHAIEQATHYKSLLTARRWGGACWRAFIWRGSEGRSARTSLPAESLIHCMASASAEVRVPRWWGGCGIREAWGGEAFVLPVGLAMRGCGRCVRRSWKAAVGVMLARAWEKVRVSESASSKLRARQRLNGA